MPSKEKAEKRYKEGKCIRCGRINDMLPLKKCSICKGYEKTPEYKEYQKKYWKEYCKTAKFKDMDKRYKLKRVEEGRCLSCGRPLLMGETTKCCKLCSEKQFNFKWD